MNIAVVILNWNGKKLLEQFLPSVITHSKTATIYVADNASTDDSIAFINTHYPSVKIIKNTVNGGYAKGYNDALKHIKADVFCLLNSDIEVTTNWLTPILSAFTNTNAPAIIQPKILDFKKKTHFEYAGAAGGYIDKYGYPYCRGRIFDTLEADNGQYNDAAEITWASGACLFIKANVFFELNGFDESFFAHMEEIDLCLRAKNKGYSIKYIPEATVYHVGGATLNHNNPQKTYLNFRNSLFTITKNYPGPLFGLIFKRLTLDGIAGILFLAKLKPLHTFAILKSHIIFYTNLKQLLLKRKHINPKQKHYTTTSIVWQYFIKNKNKFNQL